MRDHKNAARDALSHAAQSAVGSQWSAVPGGDDAQQQTVVGAYLMALNIHIGFLNAIVGRMQSMTSRQQGCADKTSASGNIDGPVDGAVHELALADRRIEALLAAAGEYMTTLERFV